MSLAIVGLGMVSPLGLSPSEFASVAALVLSELHLSLAVVMNREARP